MSEVSNVGVRVGMVKVKVLELTRVVARQLDIVYNLPDDRISSLYRAGELDQRILGSFNLKVLGRDYPSRWVSVVQLPDDQVILWAGTGDYEPRKFQRLVLR